MINDDVRGRSRHVRLLALDSDGVLTDGGIYIFNDGSEFRRFDVKDGMGLTQVINVGIQVAIISGAANEAVCHRAQQLGISEVHIGVADKLRTFLSICQRLHIELEHVAYMGDDLSDLPIMAKVGLPCAPSDAVELVKDIALYVTVNAGGHGAVREACDLLSKSKY